MPTEQIEVPRLLKAEELAMIVLLFRDSRKWSQEQLSQISGLSVRTIQRIEKGQPSDLDSRRALARAFEIEDIDAFNKPHKIPTADEMKAERENFEKEHLTLDNTIVMSARKLATQFEICQLSVAHAAVELDDGPAGDFAALSDYLTDYRECADTYSATQKLDVYKDLKGYIDSLDAAGIAVCYAVRHTKLVGRDWINKIPWETSIVYMTAFSKKDVPEKIIVLRRINLG